MFSLKLTLLPRFPFMICSVMGSWEDTLGKYYSPGMQSGPDCNEFPGSSESVSPQQWKGVLKRSGTVTAPSLSVLFLGGLITAQTLASSGFTVMPFPMKGPSLFLLCCRNMFKIGLNLYDQGSVYILLEEMQQFSSVSVFVQ